MLARHTYITYEIERFEVCMTMRDLYNVRDKFKREKMGNRSPIYVFIEALSLFNDKNEATDEFFADYLTKFGEEGDPLIYLFVLYGLYRKLLMANPEILIFDSTYRINRYKMPLVNIIDIISCNKSFWAGSAFILSKKVLDFEYVFKTIKKVYDIAKLSYPITFVTDGDSHIVTVMGRVFPNANYILCIWHVNGNIQTRILLIIRKAYDHSDSTDIAAFIDEKWNAFKYD
jgi:MULE transposase domain